MPLRIGFDMDGVLADFAGAYQDVEVRLFGPVAPSRPGDPEKEPTEEGDSPEEGESRPLRRRHDTVWQRPSWRLGARHGPGYAARIRDYFGVFSGGPGRSDDPGRRAGRGAGDAAQRAGSAREQALAVFEIEPPFTPVRLKARYKALVKLHHPDAHGGDKVSEEKLKIINQAYATLKASYFS